MNANPATRTRTADAEVMVIMNRAGPRMAWALARIKARARHVLWLNPEQPSSWMFGDSAMRDYLPHISRAEVVTNLASLKRVIDELML